LILVLAALLRRGVNAGPVAVEAEELVHDRANPHRARTDGVLVDQPPREDILRRPGARHLDHGRPGQGVPAKVPQPLADVRRALSLGLNLKKYRIEQLGADARQRLQVLLELCARLAEIRRPLDRLAALTRPLVPQPKAAQERAPRPVQN